VWTLHPGLAASWGSWMVRQHLIPAHDVWQRKLHEYKVRAVKSVNIPYAILLYTMNEQATQSMNKSGM